MDKFDKAQRKIDELAATFNMYTEATTQIAPLLRDAIEKLDSFPVNEFATVLGSFEPVTEADRDAEIVCSDWMASIESNAILSEYAKGSLHRAQLAERDAEIAQLRKRVAEAGQIVRAGEAERKALAAQVAELQAWRDAVPMFAIAQVAREPELASWDPIQEMRDWLVPLGYD